MYRELQENTHFPQYYFVWLTSSCLKGLCYYHIFSNNKTTFVLINNYILQMYSYFKINMYIYSLTKLIFSRSVSQIFSFFVRSYSSLLPIRTSNPEIKFRIRIRSLVVKPNRFRRGSQRSRRRGGEGRRRRAEGTGVGRRAAGLGWWAAPSHPPDQRSACWWPQLSSVAGQLDSAWLQLNKPRISTYFLA